MEFSIYFLPNKRHGTFAKDTTVLEAARQLHIPIAVLCGGVGLCGKCKVRFQQGVPAVTQDDKEHLTESELNDAYRLACKAVIQADSIVEIPQHLSEKAAEILTHGLQRSVQPRPLVQKHFMQMNPPQIEEDASDLEKILNAIPDSSIISALSLSHLQRLPYELRQSNFAITAVVSGNQLIGVEPEDTSQKCYGLAVDLGTTTVVMKLIDLVSGQIIATSAQLNSQRVFGEDVIARISHANRASLDLLTLQTVIIEQMNEMIKELTTIRGIDNLHIYQMVVAGNTVMQHLFLGVSPRYLAEMPYIPVFCFAQIFKAKELGLHIQEQAGIHLFPCIGRFVGGDTAAVLLTLAGQLKGTWLAVDIGTNGEIVLCHEGKIRATSAAAGPAFEGAHIAQGMRAASGAIDRVFWQDGHLNVHVIGEGEAQGICGSGLIDAVGALLQCGALDATGRFLPEHPLVQDRPHSSQQKGLVQSAVLLDGNSIWLTQKDIREVQLAKSAIATAIHILLKEAHLTPTDLENIYLAGAFGQYIRKDMALAVGLLPSLPEERIVFIGNAACAGAELALISEQERALADTIARDTEYIEIATDSLFSSIFADNLFFPEIERD